MSDTLQTDIVSSIQRALREDLGNGDATSIATIPAAMRLEGRFLAKSAGVVAGIGVAREVFHQIDESCEFSSTLRDGERVEPGRVFAEVTGPGRAILSGERTALNFLQRMSGIATLTRTFVDAVAGTKAVILDTRKTVPGLRTIDKLAVRLGGGKNHRIGLFDMVLIKDNHIDAAGGIRQAVEAVRSGPYAGLPVEVECRTIDDVELASSLNVDRLLLDNMDLSHMRSAVARVAGRVPLEASGNVSLETVRAIAETGVDFISVGALTHSVKAMDISMKIQ